MLSQHNAAKENISTQLTPSEFQKIRDELNKASREQLGEVMKVALKLLYGG
ncbi:MAG: hypothetical protein F6J86_21970 [Symploca sp. SIO1B1]|nr:hypothetical protein [Symploca sp. SIO1A3]NER96478.1 hypothetical protein [Symploca sp. SIO1B1]